MFYFIIFPCIHAHDHTFNIPNVSLILFFYKILDCQLLNFCVCSCMHTLVYTCSYVCTQAHYCSNCCSVIIKQKSIFLCFRTSCKVYILRHDFSPSCQVHLWIFFCAIFIPFVANQSFFMYILVGECVYCFQFGLFSFVYTTKNILCARLDI